MVKYNLKEKDMINKKTMIINSLLAGILITTFLFFYNGINKPAFSTKTANSEVTERLTYKDYYNIRYGFSIKYPSNLIKGTEPENGDGMTFTDGTGSTKLLVFGSNNVFNATAKSAYNDTLKEIPKVSYKKQFGNWYVVSWVEDNKIVYKKEVVGKGSINTLIFKYPVSQKELYSGFLQSLKSYFKTPGINEAH